MSDFKTALKRLKKRKLAIAGIIVFLLIVILAVFAPVFAPHSPEETNVLAIMVKPCAEYPMGTDNLGRCVLSRVIYSGRITLLVGVVAVAIATVIGTALGLIAGYFGGPIDTVVSGFTDALWAFPTIILALAITTALGKGLGSVLIAVGVVSVPAFARIVRSSVLSVSQMEYVQAAKAIGLNDFKIICRYILPNVLPVIIVQASLNAATSIIAEASLSFLGVGIQPPQSSWGYMIKIGYPFIWNAPWLAIFPGIMLILIVLSLNFIGDGLRDALDVRLKAE